MSLNLKKFGGTSNVEKGSIWNLLCIKFLNNFNRYELALIAGHKNYFTAHLSSKMAGTLEKIKSTLDTYLQAGIFYTYLPIF